MQPLADLAQFEIDHVLHVVVRQVAEDDDVVHAVDELRPEDLFDLVLHAALHAVVRRILIRLLEAERRLVLDRLGAGVGRHDQDRVAEVDVAAEAVGQPAFFHDLQQHVEDVGVGLLDFVEQHDRVRPAADLLGELAAFFVADVARRGADQAG